jgi:hypothetical protein
VAVIDWMLAETPSEETVAPPPTSAEDLPTHGPTATGGPSRCRERGCESPAVAICAYVDGRGRACATHWCLHHLHAVGRGQYCRRHASTMAALGTKAADPRVLPPVDHRGASLVSWVFEEGYTRLNPAVASTVGANEVVFEDRDVNISRSAQGGRRWERGWRIGDSRGLIHRIVLRVDEHDDATVLLVVDDRVVAKGVPPWIGRRRHGDPVPPEGDETDRHHFYEFLERFLRQGLAAGR